MSTNVASNALWERLIPAVSLGEPSRVVERIAAEVSDLVRRGTLDLPEPWRRPRPDTYARRLLYRDPSLRFTVVVMTWGPGQGTPLHDHGGLWCVECVAQGRMEAEQFEPIDETEGGLRFASLGVTQDEVGCVGALVPPLEYHRMVNPSRTEVAVTVHVYGGELARCSVFVPRGGGLWAREPRRLAYTE